MADRFAGFTTGLTSPITHVEEADFSVNDYEFAQLPRAIYVESNDQRVVCVVSGVEISFGLPASDLLPIRATSIKSTSTVTKVVGLS